MISWKYLLAFKFQSSWTLWSWALNILAEQSYSVCFYGFRGSRYSLEPKPRTPWKFSRPFAPLISSKRYLWRHWLFSSAESSYRSTQYNSFKSQKISHWCFTRSIYSATSSRYHSAHTFSSLFIAATNSWHYFSDKLATSIIRKLPSPLLWLCFAPQRSMWTWLTFSAGL